MVDFDRWELPEGVNRADLWWPDRTLARMVPSSPDLDLFVRLAPKFVTQQKRPLYVEPFQVVYLADHFAGAQVTTVIQPKKLGKSTIVSAVALFHALITDDCDVIIVARSKTQAKIIYRHCVGFIRRSTGKELDLNAYFDVREGTNEIRCLRDMGRIRVLAADDSTLEGVEPTLGVIDEYGQHPDSSGYDPLNDGLDTRDGRLFVISNAGDDEEGPLGLKRADMLPHAVYQQGPYRYARRVDGSEALHEWGLPSDADSEDLELVLTTNPASWMTLSALGRRHASRSTVARWQRMACGMWVRGDNSAIQPFEWDGLMTSERIPAGASIFLGLDVAFSGGKGNVATDTTALVPHHWTASGRRLIGDPIILVPPPGDGRLDDRAITWALDVMSGTREFDRAAFEAELLPDNDRDVVGQWADAIEPCPGYAVKALVFDPNAGAEQLINAYKRAHPGVRAVIFDQGGPTLGRADGRFMEALRAKQLAHTGHRGLRQHVLTAVERSLGKGDTFLFDHPKRPRLPQDALRAASMAHDAAVTHGGTGHVGGRGIYFG